VADSPNPPPAHTPGAAVGRNELALVSVLLSCVACVFTIGLVLYVIIAAVVTPRGGLLLAGLFPLPECLVLLAPLGAIVTGHLALSGAKRYPPQQARRGTAVIGLVLGYLSLLLYLGMVGLIIRDFPLGFPGA
jgi:hypothetical protein